MPAPSNESGAENLEGVDGTPKGPFTPPSNEKCDHTNLKKARFYNSKMSFDAMNRNRNLFLPWKYNGKIKLACMNRRIFGPENIYCIQLGLRDA